MIWSMLVSMDIVRTIVGLCMSLMLSFPCSLGAMGSDEEAFSIDSRVEIVVPASKGGGSDIMARTLADSLSTVLSPQESVEVVNKPGGSGLAAVAYANSRPQPDTVLCVANTSHLLRMYQDTGRLELVPIVRMVEDPVLLVVPNTSEIHSVEDFVSIASNRRLMVGTADILDRYCVSRLNTEIAGNLQSVYYDSALPIVQGLLSGRLDAGILNPSEAQEEVHSGNLKIIAIFSDVPNAIMLSEAESFVGRGYGGLDLRFSRYVMGPENMSGDALDYWCGVLEIVAKSTDWMESYVDPGGMKESFISKDELDKFLIEYELPMIESILAEGVL